MKKAGLHRHLNLRCITFIIGDDVRKRENPLWLAGPIMRLQGRQLESLKHKQYRTPQYAIFIELFFRVELKTPVHIFISRSYT